MSDLQLSNLEKIVCPICNSSDSIATNSSTWSDVRLPFVLCQSCGLKYMNPRPTAEWYEEYYSKTFWFEHSGSQDPAKTERKLRKEKRRAVMLWMMVSARMELGPADSILDVGTGWGTVPEFFHNQSSCQVYAIEPSDWTSADFRKKFGEDRVIARSIYEAGLVERFRGRFKLIIFSTVLENTSFPLKTLQIVRELLADDGMVFIHTPNFYYEDSIGIFHPHLFSPESLERALGLAGLAKVWMRHSPRPGDGVVDLPKRTGGIIEEADPVNPLRIDVMARKGKVVDRSVPIDAPGMLKSQSEGMEMMAAHTKKMSARAGFRNRWVAPLLKLVGRI